MHRRQQFWFDPEKVQGKCLWIVDCGVEPLPAGSNQENSQGIVPAGIS